MKVKTKTLKTEVVNVELDSEDIERIVYEHLVREGFIHNNKIDTKIKHGENGDVTVTQTVVREEA